MERPLVLLVEGESASRSAMRTLLEDRGFEVVTAPGASAALDALRTNAIEILLADVSAPGAGDEELPRRASRLRPAIVTLLLDPAHGSGPASRLPAAGAFDVVDPTEDGAVVRAIERAVVHQRLLADHLRLRDEARFRSGFHRLVGRSEAMERVRETLERLAGSETPVLVTGEPGAGRELAARTMHSLSPRRDRPFVVVDCAGASESVLETQMFGVGHGTGSARAVSGLLETARGGTIYLDEVGSLSLRLQERLLEALLEGFVRRIGAGEGDGIPLDARVTASTSADPERAVREHRFREDLFRNLAAARVRLPALRERREDIPLLAHAFVESIRDMNELPPLRLLPETIAVLERHRWPGNVRELRNAVEYAVILASDGVIRPRDLPDAIALPDEGPGQDRVSAQKFRDAKKRVVETFERAYLSDLLEAHRGNVTAAAQHAGMLRSALQRLLRKYDLKSADFRREAREAAAERTS